MFRIYNDGNGYLIMEADQPHNSISVAGTAELLQLRKRINDAVDTLETDGIAEESDAARDLTMITTAEGREMAEARGHTLHNDTILMAIKAGSIPGAGKNGGRWEMPRRSFARWLDKTIKKRERLAARA